MRFFYALSALAVLVAIPLAGYSVPSLRWTLVVLLPYAAMALFLLGVAYRVVRWAKAPVPFRIPSTCGQQQSLPFLERQPLENPQTVWGVLGRMALEVLFFRSLFRNTRVALKPGPRLIYSDEKWLWLAAMAFHWSFLAIVLRHTRYFTAPVLPFVHSLEFLDGFLEIGLPALYISNITIAAGLLYLLWRRLAHAQVRYVSLISDYFPLLLLLAVATTGVLMRHFVRVDVAAVKELALGLVTFRPMIPETLGPLFATHLFLVSALLAYFPFSKLCHMAGVFLSPTRNLANDSRVRRHINPWNPKVKVHTYAEWEEEFREKIRDVGLPLDEEPSASSAPAKG
jgi:nitrate reductase gamma subunit